MNKIPAPVFTRSAVQKNGRFAFIPKGLKMPLRVAGRCGHTALILRRRASEVREINTLQAVGIHGAMNELKAVGPGSLLCRVALTQDIRGRAPCKASVSREVIILEAETALARQTPALYRRWFSRWRGRGVGVNDLLNMTWVWLQRSSG